MVSPEFTPGRCSIAGENAVLSFSWVILVSRLWFLGVNVSVLIRPSLFKALIEKTNRHMRRTPPGCNGASPTSKNGTHSQRTIGPGYVLRNGQLSFLSKIRHPFLGP